MNKLTHYQPWLFFLCSLFLSFSLINATEENAREISRLNNQLASLKKHRIRCRELTKPSGMVMSAACGAIASGIITIAAELPLIFMKAPVRDQVLLVSTVIPSTIIGVTAITPFLVSGYCKLANKYYIEPKIKRVQTRLADLGQPPAYPSDAHIRRNLIEYLNYTRDDEDPPAYAPTEELV